MNLTYTVGLEDLLTYQLYTSNRSERIRKKRKRAQLLPPAIYLVCAFVMYLIDDSAATAFVGLAVIWYFLYPLWLKYSYKKHYQSFVKDQFKNYGSRVVSTQIEEDFIYVKEEDNESKLSANEIEEISEIPSLFLLKIKTGHSLVIPKNKIDDQQELRSKLKFLASSLNVPYHSHLNWQWK